MLTAFRFLEVLALYFGFGFLLSRFLRSQFRDLPFTWLFLTIVFLPIWISLLGNFVPLSHEGMMLSGIVYVVLGIFAELWKGKSKFSVAFASEEGLSAGPWEFLLYITIVVAFLVLLVLPKESLLLGKPIISDDYDRVRSVLTTAWDLAEPKHYTNPTQKFAYYYFDWYLPGIVFRTTVLTLQQTWMVQTIASYIAVLTFLLYVTLTLFKKMPARLLFLLSCTFMGGYEYILQRLYDVPEAWMEWWQRYVPIAKSGAFQVSSFYTSLLWVPHHLIAGILFLMILLLAVQKSTPLNRILIAVLFGGVFGFSAFVFVPAILSYAAWELILLSKSDTKARDMTWYVLQALIVFILCFRLALAEMGQGKEEVVHASAEKMLGLPFFSFAYRLPILLQPLILPVQQALNALGTWGIILALDLGIIAVLFFCYAALGIRQKTQLRVRSWPLLLFVSVLVTGILLTFSKSKISNDLFLRGMLVMQVAMMLGAGFFLDTYVFSRKWFVPVIGFLALIQCTFVFKEFSVRMDYTEANLEPLYAYMRNEIPRDAVVFTDQPNCVDLTYWGNRMCFTNIKKVDTVLSYSQFPNRYYLTSQKVTRMRLVFQDSGRALYSVR